ncbi:MAG: DUF4242 domain-containing protein [Methanococcoides sp.]|nr:DUF4242 domain-containing protein [Methanococcoides sp.]
MTRYIDQHKMGSITPEMLRKMQNEPRDEDGVLHHEIFFNKEDDKVWCVVDAPDKEAVRKHHEKAGVEVDWVHEIESTLD